GGGVAPQQVVGGDDQPWGAEAALDGPGLDEGLLDRVEVVAGGEALDGDDLGPLGLAGQDQAGADQHPIQVDRAGPALALLAGVLGAWQAEALAQHVEQALALPDVVGVARLAVDGAGDAHRLSSSRSGTRPRPSRGCGGPGRRGRGADKAAWPRTRRFARARGATSSPTRHP